MTNYTTMSFLLLLVTITQRSYSQTGSKCPPFPIPVINYQYQSQLHSGIGAELNLWFCPKSCDCNSSFGGLCYLFGPTASLRTTYYPSVKTADVSASYGYRSLGIPFFKPELTAGYSFMNSKYGKNFFHLDPAVGFDAAAVSIAFGYSFRSEKINDKQGAFIFRLGFSPAVFFSDSKTKKTLDANSKSARTQLKQMKKKR